MGTKGRAAYFYQIKAERFNLLQTFNYSLVQPIYTSMTNDHEYLTISLSFNFSSGGVYIYKFNHFYQQFFLLPEFGFFPFEYARRPGMSENKHWFIITNPYFISLMTGITEDEMVTVQYFFDYSSHKFSKDGQYLIFG